MFKKIIFFLVISTTFACSFANATHYYKRKVDDKYLEKIYIGFSSEVTADWETALQDAINNYNTQFQSTTKLNFYYNPSLTSCPYDATAYIAITVDNLDETEWYAFGDLPTFWTNKPGQEIIVNSNNTWKLESIEKTGLLMHEIGHTIGITHTDSGEGTAIPDTTDSNNSLFRDLTGDNSYIYPEFTADDIKAIEYLYKIN